MDGARDFSRETRASAMWSGDSRLIANGKGCEVVLTKQGKIEAEDISGVEAVQFGHLMQPVVARIFEEVRQVRLSDLGDTVLAHPKHPWMKSHFDYAIENTALVECKNYNAAVINKFSEPGEPVRIPDADLWQCVHEAAVYGVDRVFLAVLFGGQSYRDYEIVVTDEMKDNLIQTIAVYWGHVQAGTQPPAETAEQARAIYDRAVNGTVVANADLERVCADLKRVKELRKEYETAEDKLAAIVMNYMADKSELLSVEGETLVTWRASKDSAKFSASLLKAAMPDIYEKFVVPTPGSRRLLVK